MPRHVALLRGINVGGHRKVPMAGLRAALEAAGYADVATYVQSGNVVLGAPAGETTAVTGARVGAVVADAFALDDVPILVRDAGELEALVAGDPFGDAVAEPTHHHVLFLGAPVDPDVLASLPATPPDALEPSATGFELHLWTPGGIGRSKVAAKLTDKRLGTTVTARNWRTVTTLLELV